MKRTLVVMALVLLVASLGLAQGTIRLDRYTVMGVGYANSAGDSATWISVGYDGPMSSGIRQGQIPDSIHVSTWAASDTLAVDLTLKYRAGNSTKYVWTYIDSVKGNAVGTSALKARKLAATATFPGSADQFTIVTSQRSSGAATLAAMRKLWVRIERFYTIFTM